MTATDALTLDVPAVSSGPAALERLATFKAEGAHIVTVYVRLEVQDRIRNRYHIAVRDAVRRARTTVDQAGLPHPEREALHRDLARIEHYTEDGGRLPHSPGLVLFACEALDLFELVPLPRVVHTRLLLGERPRLAEAIAAIEGFGRIVVALVDRSHARFFEVTANDVTEVPGLRIESTRGGKFHSDRADSPGWGEHDFHNRIREERHRQSAAVAGHLARLVSERPCQGIVLAGPIRNTAEQQRFLSRDLAALVMGAVRLNPTSATGAEIRQAALEARADWERAHEASVMTEVEQGIGTGWAVNGARPTLLALSHGQVRRLIVPSGQGGAGYRCADSGRLVLAKGDCRGEGEPVPVPDMVTEALEEAFRQHVEVEMIDDPDIREQVDGMAALLRFR
jgi:peptide subunit release factor 1 (eRF1)